MDPHKNPDSDYIRGMFDRLAGRYDLFNHLTSLGMAGAWRARTLAPLKEGMRVLDLGCGTGDLAIQAARRFGGRVWVDGIDFSPAMLEIARNRAAGLANGSADRLRFILKKAEELPLGGEPYDLVVSGFVLRNLYANIDRVLAGVYKSLTDGGIISFLDITEPDGNIRLGFWRFYMHSAAALYGKILFGGDYPTFYLTESASRFMKTPEFVAKLEKTGFRDIRVSRLMMGVIVLYQARKPGVGSDL